MAIVETGSVHNSANGTAPTATLGSAPAEGEIVFAWVATTSAPSYTARAGWTKLTEGVTTHKGAWFWKVAPASDVAQQNPCDLGTSATWGCTIIKYSGVDATPVDVENAGTGSGSAIATPSINPVDSVERVFPAGCVQNSTSITFSSQQIQGTTSGVVLVIASGRISVWYKIVATTDTNTYSGSVTSNKTGAWAAGIVAGEAAAAVAARRAIPLVLSQAVRVASLR